MFSEHALKEGNTYSLTLPCTMYVQPNCSRGSWAEASMPTSRRGIRYRKRMVRQLESAEAVLYATPDRSGADVLLIPLPLFCLPGCLERGCR